MKRLATVVFACSVLGLTAQPATASPPPGDATTCTRSYEALTLEQLLAQAERNAVPEANARNLFESVNNNEDAWICSKKQPSPDPLHYNFIDNQAIGRRP
jgi:hypothetical protein